MDALQYLKEKYEIEGNTHYFREPDLPLSTSLEKVCKYMQEYSDQQNAELRERVKELEGICEYALKAIKAVNSPFGATKPIIERIEKALKK